MKRLYTILIVILIATALFFLQSYFPGPSLSPASGGCIDSDGGRDYYTKGTITIASQPEPAPTPTPMPKSDTSVVPVSDDSGIVTQKKILAPESAGVKEGTVKPVDTDGIKEPALDVKNPELVHAAVPSTAPSVSAKYKYPKILFSPAPPTGPEDSCLDSKNVKEYYCDGEDSYATQNKFCPNGCENGACVKGREPFCSKIGTAYEGWYHYDDVRIKLAQCDGDSSQCKTPGFSGKIYGGTG
jgi:hypothetical protein